MVGMWLRVQEHLDVLEAEAELCNARHDHGCGGGIAAIEHDVALGSCDQEGRGIACAHVVQVTSDAERFGGPPPPPPLSVHPPPDQDHRKKTHQPHNALETA